MEVLSKLPKSESRSIDLRLLGQTPPPEHLVSDGDILGIYIEGGPGQEGGDMPVRFPDDKFIAPAIGYPIPVRNGGFIRVPQVGVLHVRGMTVWQIEERIRQILTVERATHQPDRTQIHVSLMWKRAVNVMVVRQEEEDVTKRVSPSSGTDADRRSGRVVELPAFRNDVLNALLETGGLPNGQAENAVYVFKRNDRRLPGQSGIAANAPIVPPVAYGAPQPFMNPSPVQLAQYSNVLNGRNAHAAGSAGYEYRNADNSGMQTAGYAMPKQISDAGIQLVGHSQTTVDEKPLAVDNGRKTFDGSLFHDGGIQPLQWRSAEPLPSKAYPDASAVRTATYARPVVHNAQDSAAVVAGFGSEASGNTMPAELSIPGIHGQLPTGVQASEAQPALNHQPFSTMTLPARSHNSRHPDAIRIPLTYGADDIPVFSQNDVILEDGDIVLVESRENEYFYTGGLLGGAQYELPRNHDIDVIDAVLIADTYSRSTQFNAPTRAIGGVSVLNRDVTVGASRVVI